MLDFVTAWCGDWIVGSSCEVGKCGPEQSWLATFVSWVANACSEEIATPAVAGQPLAANVERLISAYEYLGNPLSDSLVDELRLLIAAEDNQAIQRMLDVSCPIWGVDQPRTSRQSAAWGR